MQFFDADGIRTIVAQNNQYGENVGAPRVDFAEGGFGLIVGGENLGGNGDAFVGLLVGILFDRLDLKPGGFVVGQGCGGRNKGHYRGGHRYTRNEARRPFQFPSQTIETQSYFSPLPGRGNSRRACRLLVPAGAGGRGSAVLSDTARTLWGTSRIMAED